MNLKQFQKGLSPIGFLLVMIGIAVAALLFMRVFPVYTEFLSVRSVIKGIGEDGEVIKQVGEIRKTIDSRLYINGINTVSSKDVKIVNESGGFKLTMEYERRFPLIGNLDGIASFKAEGMVKN